MTTPVHDYNHTNIGRSENKNMKQFSSFKNEVRPGVLMIVVSFSYFKASSSFISRYGS